jgi:NADPH:quinone reductase-like Zn-dependent oxidoreductase
MQIPSEMNAAAIDRFGDVLHTERLPVSKPGKHEVLIKVTTAGVGEWDNDLIEGTFQDIKPHFPRVMGSDGAGVVAAVGDGVSRFQVGDRVYGWGLGNANGFFAEYAVIKERDVALVPDSLSFDEAGALAVCGVTALQGLEELGLDPDDRLVIFGASGGVGHVALQLAQILGLQVFAVASGPDGLALVDRLGADAIAEGHSRTLWRDLRHFAPDGFDGALVFAGGRGWKRELLIMRRGGKVVWPNGIDPIPDVPRGIHRKAFDAEDTRSAFERLNQLVARGPFHIELSRRYPLDMAAQALKDVTKHHVGKLAIELSR